MKDEVLLILHNINHNRYCKGYSPVSVEAYDGLKFTVFCNLGRTYSNLVQLQANTSFQIVSSLRISCVDREDSPPAKLWPAPDSPALLWTQRFLSPELLHGNMVPSGSL